MDSSNSRSYVVGLTGGIASGKTAVACAFEVLGVPVIDTDRLSREVVRPGSPALAEIAEVFGPDILDERGELDRKRMRERVFGDESARRQLEAILHPRIGERLEAELRRIEAPYCVAVIPLLVEAGWSERVDRVLVVDVPESVQRERLMNRDRLSESQAEGMIDAQASREDRLKVADDVLDNTGTFEAMEAAVAKLHAAYLAYAEAAA